MANLLAYGPLDSEEETYACNRPLHEFAGRSNGRGSDGAPRSAAPVMQSGGAAPWR
jgi:hypothetical protein